MAKTAAHQTSEHLKTQAEKHREAPATGEVPFLAPDIPADAPELYRSFWQLWSAEKFFACHEVLEELWRDTRGAQRWFYNGLINCAVAVYQHRRGNAVGAARQLWRARVKLQPFRPRHYEVDVDGLLAAVEHSIAASLAELSEAQRSQLPALQKSIEQRMERDLSR